MNYHIKVKINTLPKLPNAMGNFNKWGKYNEMKRWRSIIFRTFIGQLPAAPLTSAKVTVTRVSTKAPDKDNNFASVKGLVDALKTNRIIEDDNPKIIDLDVTWEKGQLKSGHVILEIEELA